MAKVNMNYKPRTFEGESIPRDTGKTKKVVINGQEIEKPITEDYTLKSICIDVLFSPEMTPDGRPVQVDGIKKFERWELASKIYNANGIIELKSEEVTQLKDLIGKGYGPIIVGQAWEALEGKRGLEAKETIPSKK